MQRKSIVVLTSILNEHHVVSCIPDGKLYPLDGIDVECLAKFINA